MHQIEIQPISPECDSERKGKRSDGNFLMEKCRLGSVETEDQQIEQRSWLGVKTVSKQHLRAWPMDDFQSKGNCVSAKEMVVTISAMGSNIICHRNVT